MKIYTWTVETIAVLENGVNKVFSFQVETMSKKYQTAMDIAVMKTEKVLQRGKENYLRVVVCWIEISEVYTRSKYSQYKQLVLIGKNRKTIKSLLKIDFWQLSEFEKRFEKEKRKKFTKQNSRKKQEMSREEKVKELSARGKIQIDR